MLGISNHHIVATTYRDPSSQLLTWRSKPTTAAGTQQDGGGPLTITLPSPPSLHFTLGYIYTGTLVFSRRGYDLDTAFHIMRSVTYLSINALYDKIQAQIIQGFMHGLFHAFLEFTEYERITGGGGGPGDAGAGSALDVHPGLSSWPSART